ncbi:hypothetical protein F53441_14204 [Fusarium austroafricanum]|uniref:Uncharacterized protein n=1 Tax=Fusarium austroafricanum TaxID=2364996 RepID=A0A8H4JGI1_9HYPO|nr:hypothetical protein F53441_14204 [Fusarium austroafricanum]
MPGDGLPSLPDQEDVTKTYMDGQYIPAGPVIIDELNSDSSESDIRNTWSLILESVFSIFEGFRIGHKFKSIDGREGLNVSIWTGHRQIEYRYISFIILDAKAALNPNTALSQVICENQLLDYVDSSGNEELGGPWGILCIGKNVQFYKLKTSGSWAELVRLHEDMLRIDLQPRSVTKRLQHIREQILSAKEI